MLNSIIGNDDGVFYYTTAKQTNLCMFVQSNNWLDLWSVVEYLFPLAFLAFAAIGV